MRQHRSSSSLKVSSKRHGQHGQAMTEFIVVSLLFALPVFLMIPLLGKYIDMKSAAIQGARYAAWERTVFFGGDAASVSWPGVAKSDAEIRNEVRQRVFSENTKVSNDDKSARAWRAGSEKRGWRNRNGAAMLPSYNSVAQDVSNRDAPSMVNDLLHLVVKVAGAVGHFRIETKGLYQATVSVSADTQPVNMSLNGDTLKAFAPSRLTFSDTNVILANTWSANGRDHVKEQTQGLTPTGIFNNPTVRSVWRALRDIASVAAPEIRSLEIGKIEPDVVPPDRLVDE
jgi:hypothetical protein